MPYFYDQGGSGVPGADGASAFEIALSNGFMPVDPLVPDQEEWLDSLVGPKGDKGESILHDPNPPTNDLLGNNGDFWLETTSYTLYGPKAGNTWAGVPAQLLIGADGDPGTDALWNFRGAYDIGAAYAIGDVATYNGETWYRIHANGGNTGDTPVEGQFWTKLAAKGTNGATGASGNTIRTFLVDPVTPDDNVVGADGDYWLNQSTYVLYGPKAAGTWEGVPSQLLIGNEGDPGTPGSQIVAGDETPGEAGSPVSDALLAGDYYLKLTPSPATLYGPKPSNTSWLGAPSVQIEGTTGTPGTPGTIIYSGPDTPANTSTTGAPGDFYVDTLNKNLWGPADSSGDFISYIDLTGTTGPQGNRGSAVLSDDRAPNNGADGSLNVDGIEGDFWINTFDPAALVIYGPKTGGLWGAGQQLNGQAGVNGTNGKSIIAAASAPTGGAVGDLFLDTSVSGAPVLYGPKTSGGDWPYIADLKGDKGDKGDTGDFGGASFNYKFSTNNSMSDPGAGYLRFNTTPVVTTTPPVTATTLIINQVDQAAANIVNYLNTIDDSTSTVKGHFKVVDAANPNDFLYFAISGEHSHLPVPPSTPTYFTVPVWYLTGTVASFADNTDVVITFVRTGDKGDAGLGGTVAAYGVFASTQTQTNPTANAAMPMTLNVTEAASNVVRTGGDTAIRVLTSGTYNIQFSAQMDKLDAGHDTANIWFRVDGEDVDRSDTEVTIVDNNGKYVAAWNIVLDLVANQTVQVMWASADTSMRLYAQDAITTPGAERPAIPSVILTVTQVTYTQVGPTGPQGPAGSITVGTVTTGAPGTPVTVTNSGTSANAILDFVIPQGATGASGEAGSWATSQVITEVTGTSHILSLANNGALLRFTSGSAVALTVPAASTANFAIGSHIDLLQYGAGKVTVSGAVGVTIRSTPSNFLRNQYSVAALVKIGTDEWLLAGDLGVV